MATCNSADSVLDAASQIKSNATKLNTFVNGTASQTVQLGTGNPTPTLRKFVADAQDVVTQAALDAGQTVLDDVVQNKADITALQSGKADKVADAVAGNLAKLDSTGNLRDSGRSTEDFTPLLTYANGEAQELVWQNRMAAARYGDWLDEEADRHRRDMDKLAQAGLDARAAISRIRTQIQVFNEACARDRLQKRLFSGTNPTSSSKPILFVVSGQSNAQGSGEYGAYDHAEDCGQFWQWRTGANALQPLADPTGASNSTGSQWPQFARRFFALTGRKIILLNIASGGAAVTDGGFTTANTWADNGYGILRSSRQEIWNAFSSAVPSESYEVGAILWSQGETDAGRLSSGSITVQQYIDATLDVLGWTRTLIGGSSCPVLNCMIGYINTALDMPIAKTAYEAIQAAQLEIFNAQNDLYNICSMPRRFAYAWDEFMQGVVHYGPIGYHIVGDAFARAAAHYISL